MNNCIFTPHCIELTCDKSCPILAETSYLLERNGINMNSFVFHANEFPVDKILEILDSSSEQLRMVVSPNTVRCAEMFTYCAICQNWKGNRLHCNVYHLRYSKYLDELKSTWNGGTGSEELEYMKIWSESAKVLIISNIDYVNFGDFESQTLLNLIQTRQANGSTTIVISSKRSITSNKTRAVFVDSLTEMLSRNVTELKVDSKAVQV